MKKVIILIIFWGLTMPEIVAQCSKIDSLERVLLANPDNPTRVNVWNQLARLTFEQNIQSSLGYARQAQTLSNSTNYQKGIADSYLTLGLATLKTDSTKAFEKVKFDYEKALAIYQKLGNRADLAMVNEHLGRLYYDFFFMDKEFYQKSLDYYKVALKIREELKQRHAIADNSEMVGELYGELNDDKKSIDYLKKALDLRRSLGEKVSHDLRLLEKAERLYTYENRYKSVYNAFLLSLIGGVVAVFLVIIFFNELGRRRVDKIRKLNKIVEEEKEDLIKQKALTDKEKGLNEKFNFLPPKIYRELHFLGHVKPQQYNDVAILFSDLEDFTSISKIWHTQDVIDELGICFNYFDDIMAKFQLTKLRTFGDSYMAVAGMPEPNKAASIEMILAALEMIRFVSNRRAERIAKGEVYWKLRVGINTGYIVAGVVGNQKLTFDVWGEAVNIAKLMESNSKSDKVNISEFTYEYVKDFYDFEPLSVEMKLKHKEQITEYIIASIKPEFSKEGKGLEPNDAFWEKVKQLKKSA
jgi:adenylate cyclase